MEKEIQKTDVILKIITEDLNKNGQLDRAINAGNRIYDEITAISKELKLTTAEMLYAAISVNNAIINSAFNNNGEKENE